MNYFSSQDYRALTTAHAQGVDGDTDLQRVYNKLLDLHKYLIPYLRNHNIDLHTFAQKCSIITSESAASTIECETLVLPYFRSREQAVKVERLMGKEDSGQICDVESYRHPVIELRITPEHFAIELVISPFAWWDQQNLVGKLALPHHRERFRNILLGIDGDYRFGFWNGTYLSDMHLNVCQLLQGRILNEWMDTFSEGQDWLRIGMWYAPDDPAISSECIVEETFRRIQALYNIYNFFVWTSNNNFHSFYRKTYKTA